MATHVDIVAQFDDRSVMVSANELKRNLERSGDESGDAFAKGFEKSAPRIQKAYEKAYSGAEKAASSLRAEEARLSDVRAKAGKEAEQLAKQEDKVAHYRTNLPQLTAALAAEEQKLNDLRERHSSTLSRLTVRSEAFTRSVTNQKSAITDLGRAFSEVESAASGIGGGGGLSGLTSGLGGGFGGPAIAAGVAILGNALAGLIGVAASASQALIALPAAAGAAGAAFGTLQLSTLGFGDALKAVGDPQKFGEALKQLSPNAQQAALSIQALMPEFTHLQRVTQDAFFVNVAPMISQLTNELLPTVQQTTTGIATAMNSAMQRMANQLLTPETQSSIQTFSQNVVQAFQALTPAIAPLTKALGDLMAVGSSVLPQIAVAASNAATEFSAFIDHATKTGELQRALDAGLNTLEQLAPVALHFGEAFLSLAPVGEKILPDVVKALDQTATVLPSIIKLASDAGNIFRQWSDALTVAEPLIKAIDFGFQAINTKILGIGPSLGDLLNPLHQFADLINSIRWFFDPGSRPQPLRDQVLKEINDKRAQMGLPPMALPDSGGPGGGGGGVRPPGAAGTPGSGYSLPFATTGTGGIGPGVGGDSVIGGWSGGLFSKGSGSSLGKGGKGSGPKLPDAPVLPYDTSLPAGFAGVPQTAEVVGAENTWMDARHTLADKQARLNQLEKDNTATAADITKAKNDVINAQQAQNEAQLRLNETQTKQLKTHTAALTEFGVKLDQDLGISKGLAGIADNLVRFLGSLAAAPWEAKMNAISNAPGQAQGGFGLIGQLGAQGAFGPQYTAAGQAAAAGNGASALGPAGLAPGAGFANPNVNAMIAAAQAGSGGKYAAASDLVNGLSDCSGAVSDLYEILKTGQSTPARDFSTANFATPAGAAALGFQPGYAPGAFNVGVHQGGPGGGHMAATLPNGVNFESGGGTGQGATYGGRAVGALNPEFESQYHIPIGTSGIAGTGDGLGRQQMGHIGRGFGAYDANLPTGGGNFNPNMQIDTSTTDSGNDNFMDVLTHAVASRGSTTADFHDRPLVGGVFGKGAGPGQVSTPGMGITGMPPLGPSIGPPPLGGGNGGWMTPGGPGAPGSPGGPGAFTPAPGGGAPPSGGTQIGAAVAPAGGTGKGGIGASDSTMALAGMAASALDVMAPGAGQAAQTAMKLANRAIQYGGQVAGIGVQGLMQTFLPTGGSELANNSWLTKIVGGLAGAAPALPNMAGKPAAPPPPGSPASGNGSGPAPGPGDTHVTVNNNRPTEDGTGRDIAHALQNQYQPPGKP